MKILILDDMEIRHESFKRQLEDYELWHAYDGTRALKLLGENVFDIVYLDHDLSEEPGALSGYEVAKFISELPKDKRPKRVILHSWNLPAANKMAAILSGKGPEILFAPFSTVGMIRCLI